ncbi:hypothetical protein BLSTO_05243 [Blastocystis sp. subtype 1]
MKEEGIDPGVLSRNPREIVAEDDLNVVFAVLGEEEEMKEQSWHFLRRRNHPLFAKYYNKLALGAKEEEVKEQMAQEGVDPRMLEADQNEWIVVS